MCPSASALDAGDVSLQDALRMSLEDHARQPTSRKTPYEVDADIAQAIENSMSGNRHSVVSEYDLAIQNSLAEPQPSSQVSLIAQADVDRAISNSLSDVHSTPPTKMVPLQVRRCLEYPGGPCSRTTTGSSRACTSLPAVSTLAGASMPLRPASRGI